MPACVNLPSGSDETKSPKESGMGLRSTRTACNTPRTGPRRRDSLQELATEDSASQLLDSILADKNNQSSELYKRGGKMLEWESALAYRDIIWDSYFPSNAGDNSRK